MPDYANSNQAGASYVAEATEGTTPGTPSMLRLRQTGITLNPQADSLVSEERRTDAQRTNVRKGIEASNGDITAEISYKALKDMFRAAVRYPIDTTGDATSTAGVDTEFTTSPDTIVRTSGSWVTDGFIPNMKIRITGSPLNAGVATITAVSALVITCSETFSIEAATSDVKIQAFYAENGITESSFSMEKLFTDIAQYQVFTGVKLGGFSLAAEVGTIPTATFPMMGRKSALTGSSLGVPADVDTAEVVDSKQNTMTINEGGVAVALIRSLSLAVDWARTPDNVLGKDTPQGYSAGQLNLSGSITSLFLDETLIDKFTAETETSIEFSFLDPAGNEIFFNIPAMKYTGAGTDISGDDRVPVELPFEAYRDATTGVSIYINMVPAIAV